MPKHQPNYRGKCLHCQTVVKFEAPSSGEWYSRIIATSEQLEISRVQCPQCLKITVTVEELELRGGHYHPNAGHVVWPMSGGRAPAPPEVPEHIRKDYDEAAPVLQLSPKASAALSRRCLQAVLKEAGHTKFRDLSDQIDEILNQLPSYVATNLDAIRNIGNFAAHEQKSKLTGVILDVEPGEAERNLDVLDSLFDHYYVRPALEKAKRDELDKKLEEAGKPPMKMPSNAP